LSSPLKLESQYDVVILGAGPAGLAAAIAICSQVDASVLVLDGQAPGQESVGESCPPNTVLLLRQLGVTKAFYRAGHETCPGYASVWGRADVGYNDFIVNPMGPAWRLNRKVFDAMLAQKAQLLGAQLAWSTRFLTAEKRIGDDGAYTLHLIQGTDRIPRQIQTGFVIDATGFKAHFAHAIGVEKTVEDRLFATLRFATVVEGRGSEQVQLEATSEGWWYHALLPGKRVVNMIVTEKERLPTLRAGGFRGFEEALAATTFVGRSADKLILRKPDYHTRVIHSGILPIIEGKDWMAIGDAASSFDPIAGQGIYKGLTHGLLAAVKVAAWLEGSGTCSSSFSVQVKQQHAVYRRNREHVYGLERRWAGTDFWRKRHA